MSVSMTMNGAVLPVLAMYIVAAEEQVESLLSVCLFICLLVCLTVCLFICVFVCLFACLSGFFYVCLSSLGR